MTSLMGPPHSVFLPCEAVLEISPDLIKKELCVCFLLFLAFRDDFQEIGEDVFSLSKTRNSSTLNCAYNIAVSKVYSTFFSITSCRDERIIDSFNIFS